MQLGYRYQCGTSQPEFNGSSIKLLDSAIGRSLTIRVNGVSRPVVIASNRGPVSFELREDELVSSRGSGGLVSGLGPLVHDTDTMWIAAAMSAGDRRASESGTITAAGFKVRTLVMDEDVFDKAYNVIANETLWYAYHGLFDRVRAPVIDIEWYDAWSAFRQYNEVFANAIIDEAPADAIVLLQDHHLALVPPRLRDARPDITSVHFSHTPFANPDELRVLPELARTELLLGYMAAGALGFHSSRWSDAFIACARETLGVRPTNTFVSPLGPDAEQIRQFAKSPACEAELATLADEVGDRLVIGRPERLELSKNLLRGLWAFDEFLAMRPDLHDNVVFVASFSPSRTNVRDYIDYRAEIESTVAEINARWGSSEWSPILYQAESNYARAVALLRRYDVLLINPIRDGMNLVAKEGPLVNERNGTVLLSREAGAFDELAGLTTEVHPYDVSQTAQAISDALDSPSAVRTETHDEIVDIIESRGPKEWLDEQIAAAPSPGSQDSSKG